MDVVKSRRGNSDKHIWYLFLAWQMTKIYNEDDVGPGLLTLSEQSRVWLPRRWIKWINAVRSDNKRGLGGTTFPMISCCGVTGGDFGYSGHAAAVLVQYPQYLGCPSKKSVSPTITMLPVSTVLFQNARRIMNATITQLLYILLGECCSLWRLLKAISYVAVRTNKDAMLLCV